MRKIREVLRLKYDLKLSDRKIAASLDIGRTTVQECVERAHVAGVRWPLPSELDDEQLEQRLYPRQPLAIDIALPDFVHVHRELSRPGVTRQLLWQEYRHQQPEGLQYSAFCDHYREWLKLQCEPVLRFEHRAGEKCFVDYAGQTVDIIDRHTGEVHAAQKQLADAATKIGAQFKTLAEKHEYVPAMELIARLRAPVDAFFDQVMVMDPDVAVRNARLALLAGLVETFSKIADFSEIVTAG